MKTILAAVFLIIGSCATPQRVEEDWDSGARKTRQYEHQRMQEQVESMKVQQTNPGQFTHEAAQPF